jgi:uncharacterized membrane protein
MPDPRARTFPISAGIFLGLGLGGFFDGIVFHQLLQWHHMLSSWYPITNIENLKLNTVGDGLFHATTYLFVLIGLWLLWRHAETGRLYWSAKLLVGSMLVGHGIFNVVEGLLDHQTLGAHHVYETGGGQYWVLMDVAFLLWGVILIVIGAMMLRGKQELYAAQPTAR